MVLYGLQNDTIFLSERAFSGEAERTFYRFMACGLPQPEGQINAINHAADIAQTQSVSDRCVFSSRIACQNSFLAERAKVQ